MFQLLSRAQAEDSGQCSQFGVLWAAMLGIKTFSMWWVSSNHLVYIIRPDLPGLGTLFKELAGLSGGMLGTLWARIFDLHRAMDLGVHTGSAVAYPWRLDHSCMILFHVLKYSGGLFSYGPAVAWLDKVDCLSHGASGVLAFGWAGFVLGGFLPNLALRIGLASYVNRWKTEASVDNA